jgi:hypothetical protein
MSDVKNGHFTLRVDTVEPGTSVSIDVSGYQNGKLVYIGAQNVRVKKLPDPLAYINNISADGEIAHAERGTITFLACRWKSLDFECSNRTLGFVMSVLEDGVWRDYVSTSQHLTPEMKDKIASSPIGTRLIFQDVRVEMPGGEVRKIPGVNILLK